MDISAHPPDDFATAFDHAASRLRAAVTAACDAAEPGPAGVAAAIVAALEFAAADPAAARVLAIEPWARGTDGAARQERLIGHFAELLGVSCRKTASGTGKCQLLPLAEQLLIGLVVSILTEHLLDRRAAALPSLAPELVELVLQPYLGAEQAGAWARRHPPAT